MVPQTTGTELWDPEHEGASAAVKSSGFSVYWNAPTREDDIEGQITLLDQIIARKRPVGIVLAPDHSLALITAVRRAMESGIYTVVISSSLAIPPGPKLSYILNDDDEGGRLAASRVAEITHGKGNVAVIGLNPSIQGVILRARSLESTLARDYPQIRILGTHGGSYSVPQEQEATEEVLKAHESVDVIVSLTSAATRGAYFALSDAHRSDQIKLIGFDQDVALGSILSGKLDSVIVQNTYEMGFAAVQQIIAENQGKPVQAVTRLRPFLVTEDNVSTPQVQRMLELNWRLLQ